MKVKDLLKIVEKNTEIIILPAGTNEEYYFCSVEEVRQEYMDKEIELIGASICETNVLEILLKKN